MHSICKKRKIIIRGGGVIVWSDPKVRTSVKVSHHESSEVVIYPAILVPYFLLNLIKGLLFFS